MRFYRLGPFHRTLSYIPSDATVLLGACSPRVEKQADLIREQCIESMVLKAGMVVVKTPV